MVADQVAQAERFTRLEAGQGRIVGEVAQLRATLTGVLAEMSKRAEKREERLRIVELCGARLKATVEGIEGDVEVLAQRSAVWGGLNSVAVAVAAFIAWLRQP